MLQLAATTDKLDLISSAAQALDVHVSYVDYAASAATPGRQNTAIATATTTDIVAAPAASTYRRVKVMAMRNKGSAQQVVTLRFNQNGTAYELYKANLNPNDVLVFMEGVGFTVQNYVRGLYRNIAVADQALTASVLAYVASSSLDFSNLKVGTVFEWDIILSKTAAGIAAQTFDIRTGTTQTTADSARSSGFTTGTQTGVADVAEVNLRAVVTVVNASGTIIAEMDLKHNLASTGFAPTPCVVQVGTGTLFDTTATGQFIGICTTPGAAAVTTVKQCVAYRTDP